MSLRTSLQRLSLRQKVLIAVVVWVGIMVAVFVVTKSQPHNTVAISGIDTLSIPSDRKDALGKTLYNILKTNLPDKSFTSADAAIRSQSYTDNYDALTDIHHASFIVDIENIKQSYIAYYEWSTNNANPNLSGYPVTIQCLPKNLLKYGEFTCKPMGVADTSATTSSADIISRYLPYHVESKYEITAATTQSNGIVKLSVEAYMPGTMTAMTPELLSEYTTEIQAWITSKGLTVDNYSLDFIY